MSLIIGPIGPEQLELFALELEKIAAFDFVYSLASININQLAPNLVAIYMSIRSHMSFIMGQVIPDQSVLSALEIEKLNFSSLFGICPHYTAYFAGERYRTIMVLLFSFSQHVFISPVYQDR